MCHCGDSLKFGHRIGHRQNLECTQLSISSLGKYSVDVNRDDICLTINAKSRNEIGEDIDPFVTAHVLAYYGWISSR